MVTLMALIYKVLFSSISTFETPPDKESWHLSTDPAEALTPADEAGLAALRAWLRDKIPTIRLPELLIAVDNDLDWTRHFLGFDHGVGHPLLLPCNAKASN